ncbi:putative non-specific serine/threonine protein kinase [Rosa chinensis]|uniref:Putative non-specific serine/threonine protein kinase n=1 Tax=Rosa chinensis TaxID=74649 RepID=A0A2P6Q383_ROSCH|nr:G-type lectin S-receptor-like serine/threonine-protein kinase At1g11280 [Rosa chinensis]PRQ28652.1 putative non-specific serine/threonine protein kinase [Rosa chinensis]
MGLGKKMGMGIESVGILNCSMFFLFILILLPSHYYCSQIYNITASQPLAHGQSLVSPGCIFELGFFSPNGSANQYVGLWHKNISPRKVVWLANREEPLADTDTLASLRISSNGNLELVDRQQNTVWSTNVTMIQVSSSNTSSVAAVLSDDGNFVVKHVIGAGQSIWQSFDHPGDTLLPTQLQGFDTKSGTKNVLTSWRSNKDASMGIFLVGLSAETPSQLFIWINGSIPYWRSGPWDKSKFIGIPIMDDRYNSGFSLDDSLIQGTTYFSYSFFDTL